MFLLSVMLIAAAGCRSVRVGVVPATYSETAVLEARRAGRSFHAGEAPGGNVRRTGSRVSRAAGLSDGWFIEFGGQQYHPRLNSSESLIDRRLAAPNRVLFPRQFRNIETFDDVADAGRLWLPSIGVGKRVNSWLTLSGHAMFGSARIDNFRRLNGLFTVDADFDATLYALSFKTSVYPLGQPPRTHDGSLGAILGGVRPAIDQAIEVEYLDAEGDGGFRALGLGIDRVKRTYRDWNVSYNPGISLEFPVNEHSTFLVGGNYNFHVYRPNELDGWNLALAVRYFLP